MRCLFLLLIGFVGGCSGNSFNYPRSPSPKQRLVNEITLKVAIQLRKEKDLYPCGTGGQMMNRIGMLALSFNYYKPVEIEEGRDLLVTAVNTFLEVVNRDERIHPYLANYPFRPDNLEIVIFVHKSDFSSFGLDKLKVLTSREGILGYDIDNPKTKLFTTVHSETYEEAIQKIAEIARHKESMKFEETVGQDVKMKTP